MSFSAPSLTCDFTAGDSCHFKPVGKSWKFTDALINRESGVIHAPVINVPNESEYCFGISYKVVAVDTIIEKPKLSVYRDGVEIWSTVGHVRAHSSSGQVTVDGGVIQIQITSEGRGLYEIYQTELLSGPCEYISGKIYLESLTS